MNLSIQKSNNLLFICSITLLFFIENFHYLELTCFPLGSDLLPREVHERAPVKSLQSFDFGRRSTSFRTE